MLQNHFPVGMAAAVLAAVLFPSLSQAQTEGGAATLEVVGRAAVALQADTAVLSFGVITRARSASEALKTNAQKTQALLNRLRGKMGPADRIDTAQFRLQPVYEKGQQYRPEGYRVENQVTLKTHLLNEVGVLIDSAAVAGADQVGQLVFTNDKESEYRISARKTAVKNARRQARELAAAADLELVRILKIREVDRNGPGPVRMVMEAAADRPPTPILPGELAVEAAVEIVYEIR